MNAIVDSLNLALRLYNGDYSFILCVGPLQDGQDWEVVCPRLKALLLDNSTSWADSRDRRNSPFRLSVAADYIEEYPNSVRLDYRWGKKTLPPTTEFLALVLRSVVE